MKEHCKRVLSLLLSFSLFGTIMPVHVFAEEEVIPEESSEIIENNEVIEEETSEEETPEEEPVEEKAVEETEEVQEVIESEEEPSEETGTEMQEEETIPEEPVEIAEESEEETVTEEVEETTVTAVYNNTVENAEELVLDEEFTAAINTQGEYAWFKYVPEETAVYIFTSKADMDTYGYLYDADQKQLKTDDDSGNGNNFKIEYNLQAGETYYFAAKYYSSYNTGSFPVVLSIKEFSVTAEGDTDISVEPNETVTMKVNVKAKNMDSVTYTWYGEVYNEEYDYWSTQQIEGADTNTLTTSPVTRRTSYYVEVRDDLGNYESVYYYLSIDNDFSVSAENNQTSLYVEPNKTTTLKVNVTAKDNSKLTYEWYAYKKEGTNTYKTWVKMEDAVTDSIETDPVTESTEYYVNVNDGYDNSDTIYFNIYVDNDFSVEAQDDTTSIYVEPNATATLKVNVTATDKSKLTYEWYAYTYAGTNTYKTWVKMEDAITDSIETDPITEQTRYYVRVNDGYGNGDTIYFYLYVDNKFSVTAQDNQTSIYVDPNTKATLKVNVTATDKSKLTYKWYEYKYVEEYGYNSWVEDTSVTSDTYETKEINTYTQYYVNVNDGYGNSHSINFYVRVDNDFSVQRVGDSSSVYVPANETTTLAVNVTAKDDSKLTYKWYTRKYDESGSYSTVQIEDANTNSIETDPVTRSTEYRVTVDDGYGNNNTIYFYIYVDNNFSVSADEDTEIYVDPNATATLKVNVTATDFSKMTYTWEVYKYVEEYGYTTWVELSEADGDTVETDPITNYTEYRVTVDDGYDNSNTIYFYLYVDNDFSVTRIGDETLFVPENEKATLSVETTVKDDSKLTYEWYKEVYDEYGYSSFVKIEGADANSIETDPVTKYTRYYVNVNDGYGNGDQKYFYVHVDNGFSAEAVGETTLYLDPDATTTLKINVEAVNTEGLTYTWYEYKYDDKTGSYNSNQLDNTLTDTVVTAPINRYMEYTCEVSDKFGNSNTIYYELYVDNNFSASAEGSTNIYIDPYTTTTLKVNYSMKNDSKLTFRWEKYKYNDETGRYSTTTIEGANTNTVETDSINKYMRYRCYVDDGYGTSRTITFNVYVQNGFSVERVGNQTTFVPYGETQTLKVNTKIIDDSKLTYKWYMQPERNSSFRLVEGANTDTLVTDPVQTYRGYYVTVDDGYGNSNTIYFYVGVENGFDVKAEGNTNLAVDPNTVVPLKVIVTATDDSKLTYKWYAGKLNQYEEMSYKQITGADTDTINSDPVDQRMNYYVIVDDGYGNQRQIYFYLSVDNNYSVTREGKYERFVEYNTSDTLKVNVTVKDGSRLTYKWYTRKYRSDGEYSYVLVKDANTDTIQTDSITRYTSYYVEVNDGFGNSDTVDFYIGVENGFSAKADGSTELYLDPDATTTLKVNATAKNTEGLTYTWSKYKYDDKQQSYFWTDLKDVTENTVETDPLNRYMEYRCVVEDMYGTSATIDYELYVDNNFSVTRIGDSTRYVAYEKTETLQVKTTVKESDKLTYTWYKRVYRSGNEYDYVKVNGADTDTIVTDPVTRYTSYYVEVDDGYGNSDSVSFELRVENDFYVDSESDTELYLDPNTTTTLKVAVNATDQEGLTYQWRKRVYNEHTGSYETINISGATDTVETDPIQNRMEYWCTVTDRYYNSYTIHYYLYVENDFSVTRDGDYTRYIDYGKTDTLKVDVTVKDSSKLTYKWYKLVEDADGYSNYQLIGGAETNTLESDPVTEPEKYYVEVNDGFGNGDQIYFNLYVNTEFTVDPDENTTVYVEPNTKAQLKITATSNEPEKITYQWYKQIGSDDSPSGTQTVKLDGEQSDTYETDPIDYKTNYYCYVSDGYGNYRNIWFYVEVENEFSVEREGSDTRYVNVNETVTLKVNTTVKDSGKLTYTWYKEEFDLDNNVTTTVVEGAETNTLTTDPITWHTVYYVEVEDGYGNADTIYYNVYVINDFRVTAVTPTQQYVVPGADVTFKVKAEAADESGIKYQWYDDNNGILRSETTDTVTIEDVEKSYSYYCEVVDGYGNSSTIYFSSSVDTNFFIEPYAEESIIYVPYNEKAELKVIAETDYADKLTFQWYERTERNGSYSSRRITRGKTDTLETNAITRNTVYFCSVSNGYGSSRSVYFYVYVDDGFTAKADGEENRAVSLNAQETLKVIVTSNYPDKVTYQWYERKFDEADNSYKDTRIASATSDTFTTEPVTTYIGYYCVVNNGFGSSSTIHYSLLVDELFDVEADGESEYYVAPETKTTLKVKATSSFPDKLNYQWYQRVRNENGNYEYQPIDGATKDTYETAPFTENTQYECRVDNSYGQEETIWFGVYVDDNFEVEPDSQTTFVLTKPEPVTMRVKVTSKYPESVTYQWYERVSSEGDYKKLTDATSASLSIENPQSNAQYYCEVLNGYGSNASIYYSIYFNAEIIDLKLDEVTQVNISETGSRVLYRFVPEKTDSYKYYSNANFDTKVYLLNDTYGEIGYDDDSGLGNNFLLTYKLEKGKTYYFMPIFYNEDQTGTFQTCLEFNTPQFDNHLIAEADGNALFFVNEGDDCTLKVKVSANDTADLQYEWSKIGIQANAAAPSYLIDGATSNTLTIKDIKARQAYECVVTDKYGTRSVVDFKIYLDRTYDSIALNETERQIIINRSYMLSTHPAQYATWTSSDSSVASVNADGKVKALKAGTAVITATAKDGKKQAQCTVTVINPVTQITLSPASAELSVGGTFQMNAAVVPTDASNKELEWSSMNPKVATIDANGKITGVAAGETDIVVYTKVYYGEQQIHVFAHVIVNEHTFGPWTVVKEATCEVAGMERRTCIDDPKITEEREIPALGHTYAFTGWKWTADFKQAEAEFTCQRDKNHTTSVKGTITSVTTDPTCEATGKTVYTAKASMNGTEYTDTKEEVLKALGHDYSEWTVVKDSTCQEEGEEKRVCSRDESHVETRVIAKKDHVWSEWVVTKEPTMEEDGEETRTCSIGNETETRVIPNLSHKHDLEKIEAVAPTCEADGNIEYYRCKDDGLLFADENAETQITLEDTVVKATGHDYKLTEWKWADDYSKATAIFTCSNDASHKEEAEAVIVTSTDENRKTVYTATVTGPDNKVYTDEKTEDPFLFDDVTNEKLSYFKPVYWAVDLGITTGTSPTTFSPSKTCTRAQFVTFLWRQQGKPEPKSTASPFKDVQDTKLSYYKAVLWAFENGITTGTSPTTFSPGNPCTRAQVVTFLWRANGEPEPKTTVNPFADVPAGRSFSKAVLWAFENKITTGKSATSFAPSDPCTRAQTVTFLYRTYAN